ncbi:ADP-ribosylation factor-like protein 9 [Tupaia chinensis]|uniref:ADP-ribosylation factor-like protein 9 n=1 Tax=Tupaia chinensis TaxID=246437 RepID=UPI000FFB0EFD|nr:ADP-ribosylation factor-like protein 9 [Tupaia chinensis]
MERGKLRNKEKGKEAEKESIRAKGKEKSVRRNEKEEKEKKKEGEKEKTKGKEKEKRKEEKGKEDTSRREEEKEADERPVRRKEAEAAAAQPFTGNGEENRVGASPRAPPEPRGKNKQILVLGLDGAGKTSVLHSLASNRVQHSVAPTHGFNAVCISTEDSQMEFLEIGGSEPFRSYWEMYLPRGLLLVFVVDSADHDRLPEAKKYLHQLIEANPILPLVVFANKQDLEAAYHITDIHEALALSEVGNDRKMFLFGTQVTETGSEIPSIMQDAKDLIAQLAAEAQ